VECFTHSPGIKIEGLDAVPHADPFRQLLHVTLSAILYATSASVSPRQRSRPSGGQPGEFHFTTHTYTLRDGRVIYSKGNDHIIDAVRCALLAREQADLDQFGEETVSLVPILTDPVFI
jgi:hypothetical protein